MSEPGPEQRRSTRQICRVPLLVVSEGPLITADTAVISKHGALILCSENWPPETTLEMQNQKTGESCKCRVVWFGGEHQPGLFKLGVEMLEERPNFWGDDYLPVPAPEAPLSQGEPEPA